jgi:hypothetical protein
MKLDVKVALITGVGTGINFSATIDWLRGFSERYKGYDGFEVF